MDAASPNLISLESHKILIYTETETFKHMEHHGHGKNIHLHRSFQKRSNMEI